ncbi:hypothetical protein Mkiyose1665_32270 [Mycobacterium kiyosense]|uniref:Uncharacterized protein n=1 Tax=Mycobacterium kiyosense TaxID=2871094 RepID=A0A9P3QA25_9MYCO|nr:hypothetical protein IWGMT90018_10790 [Mycobacterium kiyosense]GLB97778.1 hypothetical protein SRL2020226_45540 [Mycobacterium kiyosense]GLC06602.1 hypothetical protein SRL2020411_12480 [Mycobacterium kiyosense]GLD18608.1 hypothetical protein Mkiyose1385_27070 [Mycobacterium kiyosense]GLD32809.1 hypothetical protein Mkiyose1413_46920 [Mycobacterium kiyosense]
MVSPAAAAGDAGTVPELVLVAADDEAELEDELPEDFSSFEHPAMPATSAAAPKTINSSRFTKVLLQSFCGPTHDRCPSSMAGGAACCTDAY